MSHRGIVSEVSKKAEKKQAESTVKAVEVRTSVYFNVSAWKKQGVNPVGTGCQDAFMPDLLCCTGAEVTGTWQPCQAGSGTGQGAGKSSLFMPAKL